MFINLKTDYCVIASTYKYNKDGFEVFVFILLSEGEGFPASYLFLGGNTNKGDRENAILSCYIIFFIDTKIGIFKELRNLSQLYKNG